MIQNDLRPVDLHRDHCVHDVDGYYVRHVHPNRLRLVVGEDLDLDSVGGCLGLADADLDSDFAGVVHDLVGLHDLRDHCVGRDLCIRAQWRAAAAVCLLARRVILLPC